jgi:hypothetical protein
MCSVDLFSQYILSLLVSPSQRFSTLTGNYDSAHSAQGSRTTTCRGLEFVDTGDYSSCRELNTEK